MAGSSNFPLVTSVTYLVVFTFLNFLRETEFDTGGEELQTIQYSESERGQSIINTFSKHFGLFFGKQGRFAFSFFITEFVIVGSVLVVVFSADVSSILFNTNGTLQRIQAVTLSLLVGIWVSFPAIVIKKYTSIYESGLLPASFGIFATLTMFQGIILAIIIFFFSNGLTDRSLHIGDALFLLITGAFTPYKQGLFMRMLDKELNEVEG